MPARSTRLTVFLPNKADFLSIKHASFIPASSLAWPAMVPAKQLAVLLIVCFIIFSQRALGQAIVGGGGGGRGGGGGGGVYVGKLSRNYFPCECIDSLHMWSTIGSFVFGQGARFVTTPLRVLVSDCREFCVWAGNEVLYDRNLAAPSLRLCPCLWNRTVTEEGGFPAHEGVQRPGRFSTLGIVHPNGFIRSADWRCLEISNGHGAVGSPDLPTFRHCWCNAMFKQQQQQQRKQQMVMNYS